MSCRSQLILALLALLAVAVAAYDFHDQHFNELLAEELEDWDEAPRQRREIVLDEPDSDKYVKCKQHHSKACCGKGKWVKHFGDKGRHLVDDCLIEFGAQLNASGIKPDDDPFSCSRVNMMKMKVVCTTECVGKKTGMINEDGSLSQQKVQEQLEKLTLEDWQRPLVEAAISRCAPTANNTEVRTESTGDLQCNPVLLNLQHCLFQEVERSCPETKRKQDGRCKRLHERLNANKL